MTTRRDTIKLLGGLGVMAGLPLAQAAVPRRAAGPWQVATTAAAGGERFATKALGAPIAATQPMETDISVFVDSAHQYQSVFGFGGAVTDATADVFAALKPAAQQAWLKAYFDPKAGLGYTVLRTTIHSSDFGSRSYTYIKDGDQELATFDIAPDRVNRIPLLRRSLAEAASHGARINVFASPWSAPAWMKSNGSMLQGGSLLPQYRQSWANYMARFVKEYEKAGVPIWGVSVQNEPMAKQTWESMMYTAEDEARFLGDYLGPTFKRTGLAAKKIIVWDHHLELLPQGAADFLDDPMARKYVWVVV